MSKVILRKKNNGKGIENNFNQTKEKGIDTMQESKKESQELAILNMYSKKMKQFKNLGNSQGIDRKKSVMQDVLNEAVLIVMEYAKKEKIENIEKFFNRKLRHITLNKLKSFETDNQIIEFIDSYNDIEKAINDDYQEYKELIKHVLNKLNKQEKKLFIWYHVKGFTQDQITKKLDCSIITVKRQLKKLNAKIYRMKLKDLYRIDFIAPCIFQDKKLSQYREYRPPESQACKVKNAFNEITYLYKSDFMDITDYQETIPGNQKNEFEFNNDRMSIKSRCYFTPTKEKAVKDVYSVMAFDNGSYIDYHTYFYNRSYNADLINTNGCMRQWYSLGKKYNR